MNFREREEYEQWLRQGHERGWLERGGEEVRTWLGDKDAEKRRIIDESESFNRDRFGRYDYQQNRLPVGTSRSGMMNEFDMYGRPLQTARMMPTGRLHPDDLYDLQLRLQYGQNLGWQHGNRLVNRQIDELETLARLGEQSLNPRSIKGYTNDYSHTGRGPKGFQRTDERIREEAHEWLTRHPEIDATDVEIEVKDGEVTLTGIVDSRCSKRLAEDLVENIFGVKQVHNQIRVNKTESGFFLNNESKESKESRNLARSGR